MQEKQVRDAFSERCYAMQRIKKMKTNLPLAMLSLAIPLLFGATLRAQLTVNSTAPLSNALSESSKTNVKIEFQGTPGPIDLTVNTKPFEDFPVHGALTGRRQASGPYTGGYASAGSLQSVQFTLGQSTPVGNHYRAGETVETSFTTRIFDLNSKHLNEPFVLRFNVATAQSIGYFTPLTKNYGPVSNAVLATALGDIDGDRDIDLIAGIQNGQNIPYLNDGNGNFVQGPAFGSSLNTMAVALADLNGDGYLDLIVGNIVGQNEIYLNDKTGNFSTANNFGTGNDATVDLDIGDFDGDGDLDIAVANNFGQNVVYFNDGTGTAFPTTANFGTGSDGTVDISSGDVDKDGDLDIAVGNAGEQDVLYLNDNASGFGQSIIFDASFSNTGAVELGDLNADGFLDIAAGYQGAQNKVYLNDGSNGFSSANNFGTGSDQTTDLKLGDLDGDGDFDIVVGNNNQQNHHYMNDGAGSFAVERNFGGAALGTQRLALADFNGDSVLDVAVSNLTDQSAVHLGVKEPDEDSTLSTSNETQTLSSIAGSPVLLWEVQVQDQGTSDGLPTEISGVEITATSASGGLNSIDDFSWEINGNPGIPSSPFDRVIFTPASAIATAADGGTATLSIKASPKASVSEKAKLDGLQLTLSLTAFDQDPDLSSQIDLQTLPFAKPNPVEVEVVGTQLRILSQPGNGTTAGPLSSQPTLFVEDINANADRDFPGSISASITAGTGAAGASLTGTTSVSISNGEAKFTNLGVDLDAQGYTLDFTGPGLPTVTSSSFDVVASNPDTNSTLTTAANATSLSSIATGSTDLWELTLNDLGTSDGLPTTLTSLAYSVNLISGGNNTLNDFTWSLNGLSVTPIIDTVAGTVVFTGLNIVAADGASASATLQVQVNSNVSDPANLDNLRLEVSMISTGVNSAGSFIGTSLPVNLATLIDLDVLALSLNLLTQPPTSVQSGIGFNLSAEYIDSNGNRDTDVSGDILSLTRSDAGLIAQATSAPAVQGVASFTGANQVDLGTPAATNLILRLQDDAAGTVNLAGQTIDTNAFTLTVSSGGSGLGTGNNGVGNLLQGGGGGGCMLNTGESEPFNSIAVILMALLSLLGIVFFKRQRV